MDSDAGRCGSPTTGPAAGRRGGTVVIRRRRGCGTGPATLNDPPNDPPNDEDLLTTIDMGRLGLLGFTAEALSKASLALRSGAGFNPGNESPRGSAFGERLLPTKVFRCGWVPSVEPVDVPL